MTKRYYWLKLKNDFFRSKEIKKLRRIAGGDTYTIIYLKMLLLSLNDQGKLYFDGVEDTFVEELALEIDEDEDNVKVAVAFLLKVGLMEMIDEDTAFLTAIPEMIDSETDKAALMRRKRHREKQEKALQGNEVTNVGNNVTTSSNNVTEALPDVTFCYTDIDIDKDKELDNISPSSDGEKTGKPDKQKQVEKDAEEMFERLWQRYPNKKGKSDVSKTQKVRLYKIGEDKLSKALDRYSAEVQGREKRYIQHGSRWFNKSYVDYLDENYQGEPSAGAKAPAADQHAKNILDLFERAHAVCN